MSELSEIVNILEPTDELLLLQKHYNKLSRLCDILDEAEEIIGDFDSVDLECANNEIKDFARKNKALSHDALGELLVKLSQSVFNEHTLTGMKSRELFAFQKLGRAISIYKSIDSKDPM